MKNISEKGKYETYLNEKGEVITEFKPSFSAINKNAFKKGDKSIRLVKADEVVLKNLKGNKMKLIKTKIKSKWRKV
jgi:hypothetical protein